ncbi:MAG TPA: crosslink repair DNA glycosylase YcaQ family protein [Gemmataceae bacterium]|nr:crosslink repair DNA glycosylase YcaQ family protein [Gemmataceae bacterium]
MISTDHLSLCEARRIALAAQGFDQPRPTRRVTTAHLRQTIRRLGVIQIDSVNVLVQAHYQVPFARLGPYDRTLLDELVYRRREFTELWGHEASILPMEFWPLLRHRMATRRLWPYGFERFMEQNADYADRVLDEIRRRGPLSAAELPIHGNGDGKLPGTWYGTISRAVLEAHFLRGHLAIAERRPSFARVYDLAERVVPAEHHGREVHVEDAHRILLEQAARAHGIGTAADLADYYRLSVRDARPRLAELVECGRLRQVRVEGWREPAYLHANARLRGRIEAAALLSPFDPLIWYRQRVERLFGFQYRIEIYVPLAKRRWGYYVLPFLLGERLVARVDVKADRAQSTLRVLSAYAEPSVRPRQIAEQLGAELVNMARWLGLEHVAITGKGDLAGPLASVKGHARKV